MTNEITVNDLEGLIAQCFEQRAKYDELKDKASEEHEKLEQLQAKIITTLESLEMDSYKSKSGNFSYRYEESFQTPKDLESKKAFFDYLKEKGVYDTMISVNSKTLNAFAKEEIKVAEARGELDFQIPGLVKSAPVARATMRKA